MNGIMRRANRSKTDSDKCCRFQVHSNSCNDCNDFFVARNETEFLSSINVYFASSGKLSALCSVLRFVYYTELCSRDQIINKKQIQPQFSGRKIVNFVVTHANIYVICILEWAT